MCLRVCSVYPFCWRGTGDLKQTMPTAWATSRNALSQAVQRVRVLLACAGDLKLTMPTAWATALLAWGVLAFPQGWARAGGTAEALGAVRWGTDYLLKSFHPYSGRAGGYVVAYQVGALRGGVLVLPGDCLC